MSLEQDAFQIALFLRIIVVVLSIRIKAILGLHLDQYHFRIKLGFKETMLVLLASLVILVSGKPAEHQDVSLIAEPVIDLNSGDAPAYWSAECGGRTYVGSYTLMMDWAQCRDYCTYFPHSVQLGHTICCHLGHYASA